MNCRRARSIILRNGPISGPAAERARFTPPVEFSDARRHRLACSSCREFFRSQEQLDALLERVAAPSPSADLPARIVAALPERVRVRRAPRLAWLAGAAVSAAAFLLGALLGQHWIRLSPVDSLRASGVPGMTPLARGTAPDSAGFTTDADLIREYEDLASVLPESWESLLSDVREVDS